MPALPRIRDKVPPIRRRGNALHVLDQLALPHKVVYRRCATPASVADAIKNMVLRGAPLIGCAAAYGYAFGAKNVRRPTANTLKRLSQNAQLLLNSRPTAVNLAWAIARMERTALSLIEQDSPRFYSELLHEADNITAEDLETNHRMAANGAKLLRKGSVVLTICNTGALATAGIGTALGVIRMAYRQNKVKRVLACETRPYLQGSRLTLWELMQDRIPASLITDNMAAHIMKTEKIDAVFAGADRVAANADAANKIGTYGLAILARAHNIPFYIVAPSSTVDMSLAHGDRIPIEERSVREVVEIRGRRIAPRGAHARHPAFDVTPNKLITAIVTEKGVVRPANAATLRRVMARRRNS